MKVDSKILDALIGLLSDGEPINIHSLSKRGQFDRKCIYNRIAKHRVNLS